MTARNTSVQINRDGAALPRGNRGVRRRAWVRLLCALTLLVSTAGWCQPGAHAARLRGTFWVVSPDGIPSEDFDAIEGLGMRLVVLTGSGIGDSADTPGPIEALFAEADKRGLELYLDTQQTRDWWTARDPVPEIERARRRIGRLAEEFGGRPSFKGWYIPYELYMFWGDQAGLIRRLYGEISAACKRAAPDKPVLISPFFLLDKEGLLGDFRYASPEEYRAFWSELLKGADIDIVALQDSGEHLSCYTFEERRPFFEAMKAACDAAGKTFWANVETGELDVPSVPEYVRRYGSGTHVNDARTQGAWRGVPAEKLAAKLAFAGRFTDTAITWGYQQFIRPTRDAAAREMYARYRACLP